MTDLRSVDTGKREALLKACPQLALAHLISPVHFSYAMDWINDWVDITKPGHELSIANVVKK